MFKPIQPDRYIGKQLIHKSNGRILLDAVDDVAAYSGNGFLFSTNGEFHFNTSDGPNSKFVIKSPHIQLGTDPGATTTKNPAVKGDELEKLLTKILNVIDQMYKVDLLLLTPIAPIAGPCAPDATFVAKTQAAQNTIANLRNEIKTIKSEKVFIT
jgi:hypothetical protein